MLSSPKCGGKEMEKSESKSKSPQESRQWGFISLILVVLLTGFVSAASALTFWKYFHGLHIKNSHHEFTIDDKYRTALTVALQFFDVQKSGKLVNNKIYWRGNSGLEDGKLQDLDLSKGMYDAGDNIKFGFPMAFTATILSWSILEYGSHMKEVNELEHAQESLKWITDYLINAHSSDNVLFIQVGDPDLDHKCWEKPEDMTELRPVTQVNITYPGTDVAAETAAAMASASLVFKSINYTYSELLREHAVQLFQFADTHLGLYSFSIPQIQNYYNSTGYVDELLWAASWLYHATGDQSYLRYVTDQNANHYSDLGFTEWFSWDNKFAGIQVLLSRVDFFGSRDDIPTEENLELQMYRESAEAFMCRILPDSPLSTANIRTKGGLIWVQKWNPLQYSIASAFLAVLYSDYMSWSKTSTLYCNGKTYTPTDLRKLAISQADYILGNNPMKMSYLVGFGDDYPKFVHHRGASIPVNATKTGCPDSFKWLESKLPNPNVAVGGVVGGPFQDDIFYDSRNNTAQGEPTTYNSALFVGLLSGLLTTSSSVSSFQ